MISERTARQHWSDRSPIGAPIEFTDQRQFTVGADGEEPFFTIVGVVGDFRFSSLTDDAPPMVYLPLSQFWDIESLRVVVRTRGETPSASMTCRAWSGLDRGAAVGEVQTFDTRLGETIARPRFAAYLLRRVRRRGGSFSPRSVPTGPLARDEPPYSRDRRAPGAGRQRA